MPKIPDDLIPVETIDWSILPKWVTDAGKVAPCPDLPDGAFVLVANGPDGAIFHCNVAPFGDLDAMFKDEDFWRRYVEPMVNALGGRIFEAEYPGQYMRAIEARIAAADGGTLTVDQERMVDRFDELQGWRAPA